VKQRDYKVFETETLAGLKAAGRHQQRLYDKYSIVKVVPVGLTRTAVWGESKAADDADQSAKGRLCSCGFRVAGEVACPRCGRSPESKGGASVKVTNLATGEEREYVGLSPAQAVVNAAEQAQGNMDFTTYDYRKARWSPGGGTVACGDWCVLVNKDAAMRQVRESKRKRVWAARPRLTR
jgi:hypothetical protein